MIKRHKIVASIKEDEWRKLWQLKSEIIEKPFPKIIEILINDYFEHHRLIPSDIKSSPKI